MDILSMVLEKLTTAQKQHKIQLQSITLRGFFYAENMNLKETTKFSQFSHVVSTRHVFRALGVFCLGSRCF